MAEPLAHDLAVRMCRVRPCRLRKPLPKSALSTRKRLILGASVASSETARAMRHTKSVGWAYEEEFRAIRVQLAWRGMGVQWDGQIATLSGAALVGITLAWRGDATKHRG